MVPQQRLSEARTVVKHAPDLAKQVLDAPPGHSLAFDLVNRLANRPGDRHLTAHDEVRLLAEKKRLGDTAEPGIGRVGGAGYAAAVNSIRCQVLAYRRIPISFQLRWRMATMFFCF